MKGTLRVDDVLRPFAHSYFARRGARSDRFRTAAHGFLRAFNVAHNTTIEIPASLLDRICAHYRKKQR